MKFTYVAPNDYNDLTTGFRTIESEYVGPLDFKVYVDKNTRKLDRGVEYDHDGCNGCDNSPDDCESILLHSHNPNHIVLMAMITGHEGHSAVNQVETVCEQYNMVYQRHEPPTVMHTYDLRNCTIDTNGVVTYAWYQLEVSWEMLVRQGMSHKAGIRERQRVDILTAEQHTKADYCCEIIDYVILNEVSKNQPWKIAWPLLDQITLDNSRPIGIPDGIPNSDLVPDPTEKWGIVRHEPAYHKDGDHVVLDAVCPTCVGVAGPNPDEVAPMEITPDLPSHSEKVIHYHQCDDALCNDAGSHVEITFEEIAEKHETEWAALKSGGDTHTDHNH
jgi:hypothetical protein